MSRIVVLFCAVTLAVPFRIEPSSAQEAQTVAWAEKYYNPKPAAADLVLPMPCKGHMVFRPVEVASAGWLDDMRIEVGRREQNLGYKEDRRFDHIAGAFTDPNQPHRRLYYSAKYETSVLQYEALGETCPRASLRGRLPVVDVSWFDAVSFGQKYTEWLMLNAAGRLPVEEESPGYLRLPTEIEWEYAARGGMAVDSTEFAANLFPMPAGELSAYAWYQGSQSAGGDLQLTALLEPNPLGLYDMIGNAAEMVFDGFRLNRHGRLHGQAGGFVSKGGDIATARIQLRTAARHEHPYFDARTGRATKLRRLGFRLILTAPVIVSAERLAKIREEWRLISTPDAAEGAAPLLSKALDALTTVSQDTSDAALRTKLQTVLRDLEQATTLRNDMRDRAVRALLRVGAFLGNKIKTDKARLRSIERAIEGVALPALERLRKRVQGRPDAVAILDEAERKVREMRERQTGLQRAAGSTLSYYGDMVVTVASDYSPQVVAPQLEAVKVEFGAKKSDYLVPYAKLFAKHLDEYREFGSADTSKWVREIAE